MPTSLAMASSQFPQLPAAGSIEKHWSRRGVVSPQIHIEVPMLSPSECDLIYTRYVYRDNHVKVRSIV
jgi:hypothetical protein